MMVPVLVGPLLTAEPGLVVAELFVLVGIEQADTKSYQ